MPPRPRPTPALWAALGYSIAKPTPASSPTSSVVNQTVRPESWGVTATKERSCPWAARTAPMIQTATRPAVPPLINAEAG